MARRKKTHALAFSGIASALCVVFLYLGSIIEVLDYSVSAFCGIVVTLIMVEFGKSSALGVYVTSSVLALLLLPLKSSALLFVAFTGWYSFLKKILERLTPLISWILKLLIFNAVLTGIYFITLKLILVESVGVGVAVGVFLLSNVVFVVYDLLLTRLTFVYLASWRQRFTFLK